MIEMQIRSLVTKSDLLGLQRAAYVWYTMTGMLLVQDCYIEKTCLLACCMTAGVCAVAGSLGALRKAIPDSVCWTTIPIV